jgi:hypothetical protein
LQVDFDKGKVRNELSVDSVVLESDISSSGSDKAGVKGCDNDEDAVLADVPNVPLFFAIPLSDHFSHQLIVLFVCR